MALAAIWFVAGGGCNDQTKQLAKENEQLKKNVQILSSDKKDLIERYNSAKNEQMSLQDKVERLASTQAAGKCELDGDAEWEFRDREHTVVCRGKVKNSGDVPISNVTVMIILRDANLEVITFNYSNDRPSDKSVFYTFANDRLNQGDGADFEIRIFTKYMKGAGLTEVQKAIKAAGDRVEIKPLFSQ
jgi:hypothetical protein